MEDYNEINSSLNNVEKSMSNVNNSLTVLTKQTNQFALSIKNLSVQCINLNKQIVSINLSAMNKLSNSMQSLSQISLSNTNGQLVSLNNHLFSISKYGPISFQIDVHIEGINQITDIISQISTNINGLTGSFSTVWQEITIGKETLVEIGYTLEDVYLKMQTTSTSAKDLSKSVNMSSSTESMNLFSAATSSFDLVWGTFKKGLDITSEISKTGSSINSLYKGLTDLSTHGGMLSGVFSGLANAVGLLANPVVAVGVGLGALALGTLYFYNENEKANDSLHKELELLKKKKEALDETAKTMDESNHTAKRNAESASEKYNISLMYVQKLKDLTGEDGVAKNFEQAQYFAQRINEILPGAVQITNDGTVAWKKNSEEIAKNIEQMKQRAIVQAYEKDYIEAIQQQASLTAEKNAYQVEYNAALAEYNAILENNSLALDSGSISQADYVEKVSNARAKLEALEGNLNSSQIAWANNEEHIKNYDAALQSTDGTLESSALFLAEQYGIIDSNGTYTYDSLVNGILDLNMALDENGARYKTLTDEEIAISEATRTKLIEDLGAKADGYDFNLERMVASLAEKGVILGEKETEQLKESIKKNKESWEEKYKTQLEGNDLSLVENTLYHSKLRSETGEELKSYVELFNKNGSAAGIDLILQLASAIKSNGGTVDANVQSILSSIEEEADKFRPQVAIETLADRFSLDKTKVDIKSSLGEIKMGIQSTGFQTIGNRVRGQLSFFEYASGGFPQLGEMFIARESGPELVGRINGKTAVANNDQIVAGIEGGVYSGVAKAMAAFGNNNGSKTITIISQIDGKVVAKSVYDEHNRQVIQTGQSPLLI